MAQLTPKEIKQRFNKLKSRRQLWENHWQELADFMAPNKAEITRRFSPGEKRNHHILDSTGVQAAITLSGALQGLLTNPEVQWFELTTGIDELDEQDDIRLYLQRTTKAIHNALNASNFQNEVHEFYSDLVLFGIAAMAIDEDDEFTVNFDTKFVQEFYVNEGHNGLVNEFYRFVKWTSKDIVAMFGEEAVTKKIRDSFHKDPMQEHELIHAIYPDEEGKIKGTTPFKFISQWITTDEEEVFRKGFREFPLVVSRWTKASNETYGRSPAMAALPDVKMINKMEETIIKGAQKTIDPPLQLPDDGYVLPIVTRPGGLNFKRPGTDDIKPIFNDAKIDFGMEIMEKTRERIRQAFFIDQLILRPEGPQMTATEVNQRNEQAMVLLGPVLARQQSEFLRPLIDRVFNIMTRRDMLPEPPEQLVDRRVDVRYSSMIAKAQRAHESQSLIRAVEIASPFVQADPSVMDNIDGDQVIRLIMKDHSIDQRVLRNEDEIQKLRQQRQEQIQRQQELEQDQAEAQNLQTVSQLG